MINEHDLCERSFRFACAVSKLCLRLGTSIGANLEEGRAGQSRPDFIAKNFISLKESRETRFWLRVIGATDPPLENELQPLLQEATEFVAMLTTTIKNARSSQSRGTQGTHNLQ